MIQFNLLPEVKKTYIKAKRQKRLIVTFSLVSSSVAIGIVLIFVSIVQFGQKRHINSLTKDIQKQVTAIQNVPDVNTMLTVQNQLTLLPTLHEGKPKTSRLFEYLSQLVPLEAPVSNFSLDIDKNSITMTGTADSIATINRLVDTLKLVKYRVNDSTDGTQVFTMTSTRLTGDNSSATYQLAMTFDPIIFDNTKIITLVVEQPPLANMLTGGSQ
jgi:Tfp pilus assembly protein PilN